MIGAPASGIFLAACLRRVLPSLLATFALPCALCAAGADFRFGAASYAGDFGGTESIQILEAPFEMSIAGRGSRLTVRASYLRFEGTGRVVMTADGPAALGAGGPGAAPPQTSVASGNEAGFGDLHLTQEVYVLRGGKGKRPFVAWLLDLKWPVANEKKGLGTGERDWGAGVSYVQPLGKSWQLLASGLYRFTGDPEGVDLEDRVRLEAGVALFSGRYLWRAMVENVTPLADRLTLFDPGGSAVGSIKAEDRRVARVDLTVRSPLGGTTRLGVAVGLTDHAEDVGFLLRFSSGGQ